MAEVSKPDLVAILTKRMKMLLQFAQDENPDLLSLEQITPAHVQFYYHHHLLWRGSFFRLPKVFQAQISVAKANSDTPAADFLETCKTGS